MGRILPHCFAGCAPEAIVAALEIGIGELFADTTSNPASSEIISTYDYRDETGTPLYQVVRFWPKDFRQRRPDPTNPTGWVWNLNGTPRVLYNLPQLVKAREAGLPVYVVEGEKDADALTAVGQVATCNSGGAGKWRDEYAEHLRGLEVTIIADTDTAGGKHAEQVAVSLKGIARSVQVVEPAEGKDASDHLASGMALDQLVPVDSSATRITAPEWQAQPWSMFRDETPDDLPFLVQGIWLDGSLGFLSGPPKAGKTWIAMAMAIAIATGTPLFGEYAVPEARDVLYVALEGRISGSAPGLAALTRGLGSTPTATSSSVSTSSTGRARSTSPTRLQQPSGWVTRRPTQADARS